MKYYSTNKGAPLVDFREATLRGLAPDRGLYFPQRIPTIENRFVEQVEDFSNEEIAFSVIKPFVGNSIPATTLQQIVAETIAFPIPLVQLDENIFTLELFHGPTLAFKDIGARFMSRCLSHFVSGGGKKITVLVATSGDTGGAVADGFAGQDGIDVVILYPSGKVSEVQELQLTTHGKNVYALEIDGCFDDCQQMVRQAFADKELSERRSLTSANSINVARWLPQQFYYYFAWRQWQDKDDPPVYSVPSGNFGNICAGLLAAYAGLPARKFIAACNANDVVPRYLQTDEYRPRPTISTISNAMDVGQPGNFIRIQELYRHYLPEMKKNLVSLSVSDYETRAAIRDLYRLYGYLADPHGAVAYQALRQYLDECPDEKGIFLETAHPVKFSSVVRDCTSVDIPLPRQIIDIYEKEKRSIKMSAHYSQLKEYLISS